MLHVSVNSFTDRKFGFPRGTLASLSEHLHVVLEMPKHVHARPMRPTGSVCHKCGESIKTRGLLSHLPGQVLEQQ